MINDVHKVMDDSKTSSVCEVGMCSITTPREEDGQAGSSCNTDCVCSGNTPPLDEQSRGLGFPSGLRRFRKVAVPSQFLASSSPMSDAATPTLAASLAATPPAARKDEIPSVKTSFVSGMKMFKRNRSAFSPSDSSPSATATAILPTIVPAQQDAPAVPATRTSAPTGDLEALSKAMSLMASPSKKPKISSTQLKSQGLCLVPETSTHIVPFNAGGASTTFGNGTCLTTADIPKVKLEQRNSKNLYCSKFFFPSHVRRTEGDNLMDEDRLDRAALRRATRYLCHRTYNCLIGDCLCVFQQSDVLQFRQQFMQRRISANGKIIPQKDLLVVDLRAAWNRSSELWEPLGVAVDDVTTYTVCPAAYALLCGVASCTFRIAADAVKNSPVVGGQFVPMHAAATSQQNLREQRSEDWCLLRSYVAELVDKHEANPAPGAHQPGRMTHISKTTWNSKWNAVLVYFKDAPRVPGSKSMLKKAWKLETRLKEKKACSHSKCNICSKIDTNMDALRGVNTVDARQARVYNLRAQEEHDRMHLGSRSELDKAGLHAFTSPPEKWTILADAATQRNFMIPKFQFRVPKKLAGRPFWSYKLMATYAYGYGFTPFLVHSSQSMGANLTWTVLWLTLSAMRKHYGFWPEVLHLTLDNTSGENKNETLLGMCAWLVASGRVKQVRCLFLMVGHTHVIIDHIFGVITVGLRRKELLLPEDLVRNIEASLAENPQYMAKPVQSLHCLWDFKRWCESMEMQSIKRLFRGHVQDKEGTYTGMYDLLFSRHRTDMCRLQYREHCSFSWFPENTEGTWVIRKLPTTIPELQKMKSWSDWSVEGSKNVKDTIVMCLEFARTLTGSLSAAYVRSAWKKHFEMIPDSIELLNPSLKLTFEFFNDFHADVPRIAMTAGGTSDRTIDGEELDTDEAYQAWKLQNVDVRTKPMDIDPVVSSSQTEKEYEVRKAAMHAACRPDLHPTIIAASPIFMGDFVIVLQTSGHGVELYNVVNIENMKSPFATALEFTGVLYEHTPNAAVSGLFGTFNMKMTLVGNKRQQTRMVLGREHVKVYNASLVKKVRRLSIRSLRMLALALPEQYPFPERKDIPEGLFADDSDEEEMAEGRPRAAQRKKSKATTSRTTKSARRPPSSRQEPSDEEDDEDDEDDEEDEDDEDEEDTDEEDDEEEIREDEEDEANGASTGPTAFVPDPNVLLIGGPSVELKLDTVIALNMANDPEYLHFQHPVGFAYVCNTDPFEVYWFQVNENQLQGKLRGKQARAFRHSTGTRTPLKQLTVSKFWNEPDWFRPSRGARKPSEKQILSNWYKTKAHPNWIMPIIVPQPASGKVRMNDGFMIDMKWIKNKLIPACEDAGCVHSH